MSNEWPKKDPITNREVCISCWNGTHRKHNHAGVLVDACNGECDCIHKSEEHWAALERKTSRDNRKARKDLMSSEPESSPLRAVNENFKSKKRFVGA